MEHESINSNEDIEDGEICDSDDGYTPLQRPSAPDNVGQVIASASNNVTKMEDASELDESLAEQSSDSSESESDLRSKSKKLRIKPNHQHNQFQPNFKKYNIWSNGLQEECLLDSLKVCGVDKPEKFDRNIESYDYSLKYRLNGENSMKRRQSNNSDDSVEKNRFEYGGQSKRFRASSMGSGLAGREGKRIRKNVRLRLGHKSEDSSSNDGFMNTPRLILDLNNRESTDEDVARDIANKLYEEKDTLLLRIVEVLGRDVPIKIFKETQKIEKDGGMMIMNGQRRRTPGGVFLFLLKHSDEVQQEQKKLIFIEETRKKNHEKKAFQSMKRDREVEALKKSLRNENELTVLSTRSELLLNAEIQTNLSNPPPSPVTDCNRENSSDFDTHDIHHLNVTSPEKNITKPTMLVPRSGTSAANIAYQDDILDMNCDDMDLF